MYCSQVLVKIRVVENMERDENKIDWIRFLLIIEIFFEFELCNQPGLTKRPNIPT